MNKKPFFSVVLPTYNRANYLPFAIQSVLNQTFDDFELIISNNSSNDQTEKIVRGFDDKRIRYFKTINLLSMEDNLEFAISKARGEFITYIGDDDGHSLLFLEKAANIINEHKTQMVVFQMARYYYQEWNEQDYIIKPNTLLFYPYTGELFEVSTDQATRRFAAELNLFNPKYTNTTNYTFPYILNAVFHHSILDLVKSQSTKLLATKPGDIFLAAMVLGIIDKYYCLDEPMAIWGRWRGSSSQVEKEIKSSPKQLPFVQCKLEIGFNLGANAFLQAQSHLPKTKKIDIDWGWYFYKMYEHLVYLKSTKMNVSDAFIEFYRDLSKQPASIQRESNEQISSTYNYVKNQLRLSVPSALQFVKKFSTRSNHPIILSGEDAGFYNIKECGMYMNNSFFEQFTSHQNNTK